MQEELLIAELKGLVEHRELWGMEVGNNGSTLYRLDEDDKVLYYYSNIQMSPFGFNKLVFISNEGGKLKDIHLSFLMKFKISRLISKNRLHAKKIEVWYKPEDGTHLIKPFGYTFNKKMNAITDRIRVTKKEKPYKKKELKVGGFALEEMKRLHSDSIDSSWMLEQKLKTRSTHKTHKDLDTRIQEKLDDIERRINKLYE